MLQILRESDLPLPVVWRSFERKFYKLVKRSSSPCNIIWNVHPFKILGQV